MDNDGVEDAYDTDIDGDGVSNDMEISNGSTKGFFIDKQPTQFNKRIRFFYDVENSPHNPYWDISLQMIPILIPP